MIRSVRTGPSFGPVQAKMAENASSWNRFTEVCGVVSCNRLIVNCIRLCIPAAPVEKRLACEDSFWGTLIINKIQIPFPQTSQTGQSSRRIGTKKGKTFRFFLHVVDQTPKISTLFEDLLKLDRFAQSVEDEVNRIVSEEEGSRDDPWIPSKNPPIWGGFFVQRPKKLYGWYLDN